MSYHVELLRSAARELGALPHPIRRRVTCAISALSRDPRPRGVVLLTGPDRIWRVRVGDYRILYRIDDDLVLVVILRIRQRKDAYR